MSEQHYCSPRPSQDITNTKNTITDSETVEDVNSETGSLEYERLAQAMIDQGFPDFDVSALCRIMGLTSLPDELQRLLTMRTKDRKDSQQSGTGVGRLVGKSCDRNTPIAPAAAANHQGDRPTNDAVRERDQDTNVTRTGFDAVTERFAGK